MRQLILDIRPDSPPDFANYLPGPNGEALAALLAHRPGQARDPLIYLWGEAGVGKSHLLQAWTRTLGAPLLDARQHLPEPPVAALAVDAVGELDGENQIRLFSLINAVREQNGLLLAAGTLPPAQMGLRPDLATRLAQGLVFRVQALSDGDKAAALAIRAEGHGLRLPEEVIRYLLTHSRRDLPRLLAAVDALDTFSLSRKRPVSVPLLKEMLQQTSPL